MENIEICVFLVWGVPSEWEDGSVIYSYKCHYSMPVLSILSPSPAVLETISYCLIWDWNPFMSPLMTRRACPVLFCSGIWPTLSSRWQQRDCRLSPSLKRLSTRYRGNANPQRVPYPRRRWVTLDTCLCLATAKHATIYIIYVFVVYICIYVNLDSKT
jgi:hypothetical protein